MRPWGLVAYVYNPSHKYEKLGHKKRKCIIIRYIEHSKGYVFISEHEDETIIAFESQNVTFLEDDFPCTCEIDRNLHLYEIMDLDIRFTLKQQLNQMRVN